MTTETKEPTEPKGTRPTTTKNRNKVSTAITCDSCFYYQRLGGGSKGTCIFKGTVNSQTAQGCPWYEKE